LALGTGVARRFELDAGTASCHDPHNMSAIRRQPMLAAGISDFQAKAQSSISHLRDMKTKWPILLVLLGLLLLAAPAAVQAQLVYTTNNGAITLTGYTNNPPVGVLVIPNFVNIIGEDAFSGCTSLLNVTFPDSLISIGIGAFYDCTSLTSVAIPDSVTDLLDGAFAFCPRLTNVTIGNGVTNIGAYAFGDGDPLPRVFFAGNAPIAVSTVFDGAGLVYYLPGATGWSNTYAGDPTALWRPQIETSAAGFGLESNQFGFNISWASGQVIMVEACTNLAKPAWVPLQTNTLTNGSFYFSDPQWTSFRDRYYRVSAP
jgi:hypothetical protein